MCTDALKSQSVKGNLLHEQYIFNIEIKLYDFNLLFTFLIHNAILEQRKKA